MVREARRRLRHGVEHISAVMELYDHFRHLREHFIETANWMLFISLGAFAATLVYAMHFVVGSSTGLVHLCTLAIAFLGASAAVFSIVRGILYYIQASIERSHRSLEAVREFGGVPSGSPYSSAGVTLALVENSLAHWLSARSLTMKVVLLLIPGLLFFIIGIASLLAIVLGLFFS